MISLWKKIKRVLTRRERRRMRGLILGDVVISVLDIVFLAVLLFIVNYYTQPDRARMFMHLPGRFLLLPGPLGLGLLFLLFCVKNGAGFILYREQCRFISAVALRISQDKMSAYLSGGYTNFAAVDSALHIRKIAHEPVEFGQHVLAGVQQAVTQSVLILLSILALLIFNAWMFIWLFLVLMPPLALLFRLIRSRLRIVKADAQTNMVGTLRHLQEGLGGYVESHVYEKQGFFLRRYVSFQRLFNRYFSELLVVQGIPNRMMELFVLLGLLALVLVRMHGSGNVVMTLGAFMAAAYKIIPGLVKLLTIGGQIKNYMYTLEGMPEAIEEKKETTVNMDQIGKLEFKEVKFGYEGREPIIDRLNFAVHSGDLVGLTGVSGKGKTTVLNLALGFLKPASGAVFINGRKASGYYRRVAYVKQQPFVIHDTILKNILLDDTTPDWTKLGRVIEVAGLEPLINSFPEGLGGVIMEQGRNISGGQRQRIAIARALYKDADLILLDEPFNELDAASEALLLLHFANLAREGKIVLLITHNKKSLSYCNKIISLDDCTTSYLDHPVAGFSRG